ncbi:unnamed protein product [Arabis nemorensis]|uniref:Uncharacterized protein n=1 Tax=Arabis nemorensis TaxID=586526 RepID=A0A565CJX1_9BRAS|nr:unnamed protein product [Arabis nemorensis]
MRRTHCTHSGSTPTTMKDPPIINSAPIRRPVSTMSYFALLYWFLLHSSAMYMNYVVKLLVVEGVKLENLPKIQDDGEIKRKVENVWDPCDQ